MRANDATRVTMSADDARGTDYARGTVSADDARGTMSADDDACG